MPPAEANRSHSLTIKVLSQPSLKKAPATEHTVLRLHVAAAPLTLQSNAAKEKQAGGGAGAGGGLGAGYPQLRSLFTLMSDVLGDPRRRQQLGPVLDQLGEFAREVRLDTTFSYVGARTTLGKIENM